MGKTKKRTNRGIIFFSIISLLISALLLYLGFSFKQKKDNILKENNINSEKITKLDEKISTLTLDNNKIKDDITYYSNIEENTEKLKKEVFSIASTIEKNIKAGKSNKKIAYLTFDDGPYYNTYNVLKVLKQKEVKATFFTTNVNGDTCYDNSKYNCHKLYQEYTKDGHTIANHTYTHGIFRGLYSSTNSYITAIKNQHNLIKKLAGVEANISRFPGGAATAGKLKDGIVKELRKMNYGWIDWTAQDGDGGALYSKDQAWTTFKDSINEDIEVVLFHDYSNYTLSILPDAIDHLRKKGYILMPLFYESVMINK